jgi:excisionase family DNA binding protein
LGSLVTRALRRQNVEKEIRRAVAGGGTLGWEEAAEILGCTVGTLKVWVYKRKVPFVRVNGLIRFRLKDLDAWMDKNLVSASDTK